jgi:hypothetical protein
MADVRKNAAERWRDYRERQKPNERDLDKAKDFGKGIGSGKNRSTDDDDFSM